MSVVVSVAGQSFTVPAEGDYSWGSNVTNLLIKLATSTSVLQSTSTTFTLASGDLDFGATYGLKSTYYKSRNSNPSASGIVRLGNNESLAWRNQANNADLTLTAYTTNRLQYAGVDVPTISSTDTLTNKSLSGSTNTFTNLPYTALSSMTSAQLAGIVSDETGSGALVFGTSPTFTTSMTGPLLIGGTSTTSTLTLQTTSGVGTTNADMLFKVGNNGATEAMRILNSGDIGIGTSAPSSRLEIYNATSANFYVRGDSSVTPLIQRSSTDANEATLSIRKTRGTNASPSAVTSSDAIGTLYFQAYGGTNTRNLGFVRSLVDTFTSDSNIKSYLSFGVSPSGSASATELLRLNGAGDLCVGGYTASLSSASRTLTVNSAAASDGAVEIATNGTLMANFRAGVGITAQIGSNSGEFSVKAGGVNPLTFYTNAVERARINEYGLGAGLTPTNRNNTSLQTVNGLGFPATQVSSSDANTLDDYEEGTFTPTTTSTTGSITTLGTQIGRYTKIGDTVIVTVYLPITTNGTGATFIKVSNMPFTANSTQFHPGVGRECQSTGNGLFGWMDYSTTNLYIQKYDGTYPGGSNYALAFTITYKL